MTLPVVDAGSLVPRPQALETVDFEAYWSAWLAQMLLLMPGYNVGNRKSDPGVIVSRAFTYVRMLDRIRVNEAYEALRLALAEKTDLDGLAADRGVARKVYAPATATAAAVSEDDNSLRLRSWLEMQRWARGSSNLGLQGVAWGLGLPDVSDVDVYDLPGEGRMRCILLPRPDLDAAGQTALLARVGQGLMRRDTRPGSIAIDVVFAEVLPLDLSIVIGVLPGASLSAVAATSRAAVTAYAEKRRKIGDLVAVSRIKGEACTTSVVYAHCSLSADLVPGREQAYQLRGLTITPEVARG